MVSKDYNVPKIKYGGVSENSSEDKRTFCICGDDSGGGGTKCTGLVWSFDLPTEVYCLSHFVDKDWM